MKKNNLYVDVHVLQIVPPSCVNRDDTGSPKTAKYGGVTRSRVSSQSWKHAMRQWFRENYEDGDIGYRTKKIVGLVADEIRTLGTVPEEKIEKAAITALENAGLKIKNAAKGTDAVFFMSRAQARKLAELAVAGCKDKDSYKAALQILPSVDMALFGRMVADDPSLNYDAAAQVAHSISTHAVHNEYDYFTAVDDCGEEDNAGAAHVGVSEFNSALLYRYATVNVRELRKNLGKDTAQAVELFAEAFIRSMPTGKQNSYANRTLPELVYITVREDQPVNLVGAFERPVRESEEGYAEASAAALKAYADKVYAGFAAEPAAAFGIGSGLDGLAEAQRMDDALAALEQEIAGRLSAEVE